MGSRERAQKEGHTLERSVALTMVGPPEVFPRVDSPASVEDSMEVVSTGVAAVAFMAAEDTGDSVHFYRRKQRYGEQDHAHYKFEIRDSSRKVCFCDVCWAGFCFAEHWAGSIES